MPTGPSPLLIYPTGPTAPAHQSPCYGSAPIQAACISSPWRVLPCMDPPPTLATATPTAAAPRISMFCLAWTPLQLPPRRPAHQVLEGHTDEIFSAAFNYEGPCVPSALWGTSGAPLLRPEPDLLLATQLRRRVAAATPVARAPPLIPPSRPLPSCYAGDTIITGSKDNTCRIWKC